MSSKIVIKQLNETCQQAIIELVKKKILKVEDSIDGFIRFYVPLMEWKVKLKLSDDFTKITSFYYLFGTPDTADNDPLIKLEKFIQIVLNTNIEKKYQCYHFLKCIHQAPLDIINKIITNPNVVCDFKEDDLIKDVILTHPNSSLTIRLIFSIFGSLVSTSFKMDGLDTKDISLALKAFIDLSKTLY
jgi:hypothetical protein